MKIEKPRMDVWIVEEGFIPGISIVIVIKCGRIKGDGEFVFLKWILPLLRIEDIFDNTFGI